MTLVAVQWMLIALPVVVFVVVGLLGQLEAYDARGGARGRGHWVDK